MNIIVIGDRDTVTGFRLAGVEGWHVDTPQEAGAALEKALAARDTGLILITQRWSAAIRSEVEVARRRIMPVVVEIPDRRGPMDEVSLTRKVHSIIGI
ncbi:MAG TPA: hypothetical protein GXX51_02790 [Firmicutes bacterium]|nr:hypothetical protein [Bacillota bacterium]